MGVEPTEVFYTDDSVAKLVGADMLGMAEHHFIGVAELQEALGAAGVWG